MKDRQKSTKILIFSTNYLPYIGGAELALKNVTERLDDFEMDLITSRMDKNSPAEERFKNVNVFRVSRKLFLPPYGFFKAIKLSKKRGGYSRIFALQASYGAGAAWLFKIFHPKIPFILNLQEGKNLASQGLFVKLFRKLIIKKADIIVAISNYLADYAKNINPRAEIKIIPNGVDISKFKTQSEKLKTSNQNSNLEKVIITVSRLVPKNGIGDLIDAFHILSTKHKIQNVKLLIVGDGSLKDDLRFKIYDLGIEDKVILLGNAPHEEIPKYLALADIFVRPSLSEGLGNSFLEAMTMGVPVIGTPVGGIPDFLKDGETGLLCEAGNPENLAEKIKIVLENDGLRHKLAENGRKLIEEKYNWDTIALKFEKLYEN